MMMHEGAVVCDAINDHLSTSCPGDAGVWCAVCSLASSLLSFVQMHPRHDMSSLDTCVCLSALPRIVLPHPCPFTPFRLSTSVAKPQVQVVTHLCYSDFQDIMQAVDDMDGEKKWEKTGGGR